MSYKYHNFGLKTVMIKYKVSLSQQEREELVGIISKGQHRSQIYRNAYMLLNCDAGKYGEKITGREICRVLKVSMRMIDRIKKRFVEEGFEACIERRPPSRSRERKADGEMEARLIALSCSKPPKGHAKWTLRLLADKLVELHYVDSISHETVRKVLKKTN